ncbi:hypothetical protein [Haloarcula marismortui]|uniref:hypothetical protein n=1 Tax=Haloarcula marismortui TaxID=2238 RepID=UPI000677712A|nr:hypothetical protein [Haloarcula californiae]
MPTSDYTPADTLRPATPAGYQSPRPFRYPPLVILGLVSVLVPVAAVVFGGILWYAQGTALDAVFSVDETATGITFTLASGLVSGSGRRPLLSCNATQNARGVTHV